MYDLILVPGGGVRADGIVAPWVRNRLDRAIELRSHEYILCLSAGTPHKPPVLDATGRPVLEAVAGGRYLVSRGLDPDAILMETASYDTIGNAFFARTIHTDLRAWRRLLIVNSAFHMERTEAVFRWVFSLAPDLGYELAFDTVPDTGMPEPDLDFRRRRERESLARLLPLRERIHTLSQLHDFLFTQHGAYSPACFLQPPETSEQMERVY